LGRPLAPCQIWPLAPCQIWPLAPQGVADTLLKDNGHTKMTLYFTIGPSEYKRAMWLHMRPRKFLGRLGCVLLVLAGGVLAITSFRFITTGQDLRIVLALAGSLGSLCIYFFVFLPYQVARIYRQQKLMHEKATVEIDDLHLTVKSQHGHVTLPWDLFHKWKANDRLVLVYHSDVLFHIFPRHSFPSLEEFEAFP
jgi:hypothetical protein